MSISELFYNNRRLANDIDESLANLERKERRPAEEDADVWQGVPVKDWVQSLATELDLIKKSPEDLNLLDKYNAYSNRQLSFFPEIPDEIKEKLVEIRDLSTNLISQHAEEPTMRANPGLRQLVSNYYQQFHNEAKDVEYYIEMNDQGSNWSGWEDAKQEKLKDISDLISKGVSLTENVEGIKNNRELFQDIAFSAGSLVHIYNNLSNITSDSPPAPNLPEIFDIDYRTLEEPQMQWYDQQQQQQQLPPQSEWGEGETMPPQSEWDQGETEIVLPR